jgi:3-hydroxy-3-methylglutaryl CoA synthase
MFIVTVVHNGNMVPLRGTVWAFDMSRAQKFDTCEAAMAALEKARKFMKASVYKKAVVIQLEA